MRGDRSTSSDEPVNRNTLSQQVYNHLRAGILDNSYPPGSPLPEEALADKLKVSRVPVREALRRLSAEGLVIIKPRQGATVSELTSKQFLDAYQVREALEVLAVRLAVPKLTPDDLDQLDMLHAAMQSAAEAGDALEFFGGNVAIPWFSGGQGRQRRSESDLRQPHRPHAPVSTAVARSARRYEQVDRRARRHSGRDPGRQYRRSHRT